MILHLIIFAKLFCSVEVKTVYRNRINSRSMRLLF